ncbi:MAG: nuclear transport factor 2 family protein [Gammaproteobacteria bacterium]
MIDHPHLKTIERYYQGCNSADEALMRSTFTEDVVHYYTHHDPVRGAASLAHYWLSMQPRVDGHWSVDHGIVQGDEAVIEWTMRWTPTPGADPEMIRGAEWYRFEGGLIAEIRAYYLNPRVPYPQSDFELLGFDYAGRGYAQR